MTDRMDSRLRGNDDWTERNRSAVNAFVEAINAQDWDRLNDLVAVDVVRHSRAAGSPPVRSRGDLKRFLQSEVETFPDATERIEDTVAEGNKVAVRHSFRGTQRGAMGSHPATNKCLQSAYLAIYRLEDGKIAEIWAEWDNLDGLRQLGHLNEQD